MKLSVVPRKKRFSEPVPPIKRIPYPEPTQDLSDHTKARLVALAVLRTICWTS